MTTTPNHPFYEVVQRRWLAAAELESGMRLLDSAGGEVVVAYLETVVEETQAFNLEVRSKHVYFVRPNGAGPGVLVHNMCAKNASQGGAKTAGEMASDLAGEVGKNRVGGRTAGGRVDIDLQGKGHFDKKAGEVIETPHVHEQKLHTSPDGKSSLGSKTTRPADKNDIRTARKLAEQQGLLEE